MSVLDDFNRTNSATTLGSPWVAYTGTWGVASNKAYLAVGGNLWNLVGRDCGSADGEVSVVLGTVTSFSGVAFRITDDNNYYMLALFGGTDYRLYRKATGGFTQIASGYSQGLTAPANGDTLTVQFTGHSVVVLLNGVGQLGFDLDRRSAATIHGLVVNDGATAARFDDFAFTAIAAPAAPTDLLVCVGDSRTMGYFASAGNGTATGTTYPARVAASLGSSWLVLNKGLGGDTVPNITARVTAAWFNEYGYTRKVAVVWGGLNDKVAGADAATIYSRLTTLVSACRTAGATEVYVCTEVPASLGGGTWEAVRATLNALLASGLAGADGLIDRAATVNDNTDLTIYKPDGTHFVDGGFARIAEVIRATILPNVNFPSISLFDAAFRFGFGI